jgi:hypothetical protein
LNGFGSDKAQEAKQHFQQIMQLVFAHKQDSPDQLSEPSTGE